MIQPGLSDRGVSAPTLEGRRDSASFVHFGAGACVVFHAGIFGMVDMAAGAAWRAFTHGWQG